MQILKRSSPFMSLMTSPVAQFCQPADLQNNPEFHMKLEQEFGCQNYAPIPVVLSRGEGVHVYDVQGKEYFDCLSAYSAVNQGHCHPIIRDALVQQASQLTLASRAFYTDQLGLTEHFLSTLFGYEQVLMMNTGVEAGESAIKIARRWGYDVKGIPDDQAHVLFAKGNFWGRTIAACASSDDPDRYARFGPFNGLNFSLVEYDDLSALEQTFQSNPNICAYMLEPIQGENGVKIPSAGYLKGVRKLCDEYNVLMICDEVQTGCGRTGALLCTDHDMVRPDLVLLGKSVTGGFYPASVVLADKKVMGLIKPNEHGSTYGGNPLACAVTRSALSVLVNEKMVENSYTMGQYLLSSLQTINKPFIKDIRGKGLMCAIEFHEDYHKTAWDLCLLLKEEGVLCKPTKRNIIRFSPPLIITKEQVDQIVVTIRRSVDRLEAM